MDYRPVALALLLHCCTGGLCGEVAITGLHVPRYARLGHDVQLECRWSAPLEKLYSVKWYLDDQEFFRYKPQEFPSLALLPLPGVTVNMQVSTGALVVLQQVQVTSSGRYKCEVIAEWPSFHTADKSAPMTVVEIPEEKPRISGTQPLYRVGDVARLTCTSARSLPPARLTWYINDQKAPPQYLVPGVSSQSPGGLKETQLGLVFRVLGQHLVLGELRLRCSATISSLYYKTQQHTVQGRPSYTVPVMESRDISGMSGGGSSGGDPLVMLRLLVMVLTHWWCSWCW